MYKQHFWLDWGVGPTLASLRYLSGRKIRAP